MISPSSYEQLNTLTNTQISAVISCQGVTFGEWKSLPAKMRRVSAGVKGIYGLDLNKNVYVLDGFKKWHEIAAGGNNREVASSVHQVWIVKDDGSMFVGDGERDVSRKNWTRRPGNNAELDVSNGGNIWAVNRRDEIWRYRRGSWVKVGGAGIHITVGDSGVWHVNRAGRVYYRWYTYNDQDTDGDGWVEVSSSPRMKWLASGTDILLGLRTDGALYYRAGMATGNPTGTEWVRVPGVFLRTVSVNHNLVIGTDRENTVKYTTLSY